MYRREKVVSFSIILMIPLLILTEKINAISREKQIELRCRGSALKNAPLGMCNKPNGNTECKRLCKASFGKTGFIDGKCIVRDNNRHCNCYDFICSPPLPPRKGLPPPGWNGK
ncbi:hypothetical protein Bca4012_040214 [Brassica carinata]